MKTNTKSTLDDILLDQTLDHILNCPEEEFVKYMNEFNLDPAQMAAMNSAAAQNALDEYNVKLILDSSNIDPAAVRFSPSEMLKVEQDSQSYVEKFLKNAKSLGYKFSKEFIDSLSDSTLQQRMAFRYKSTRHGKGRKKGRS